MAKFFAPPCRPHEMCKIPPEDIDIILQQQNLYEWWDVINESILRTSNLILLIGSSVAMSDIGREKARGYGMVAPTPTMVLILPRVALLDEIPDHYCC
jgi:hypothetical protein